jgi:hypothetical protein
MVFVRLMRFLSLHCCLAPLRHGLLYASHDLEWDRCLPLWSSLAQVCLETMQHPTHSSISEPIRITYSWQHTDSETSQKPDTYRVRSFSCQSRSLNQTRPISKHPMTPGPGTDAFSQKSVGQHSQSCCHLSTLSAPITIQS